MELSAKTVYSPVLKTT